MAGLSDSRSRDPILDAWRGFSVLLVIWSHFIINDVPWSRLGVSQLKRSGFDLGLHLFGHYSGQIGVQCFFVISGYIITTLLVRESERNGGVSLSAFYVRRSFRILPPMVVVLIATWSLKAMGIITFKPSSFLLASSFLCNTDHDGCGWFVGHMWSLGVEEQFYLLWPLLLVATKFRYGSRLAFGVAAGLFVVEQIFPRSGELGIDNAMSFACIAIGCLYATSEPMRLLITRAASIPAIAIACALLLAQPAMSLWFRGETRLHNLLHPLLICFVMFACFRYRAFLERRFIVRALAGVGLISYGLYLWQQMFLGEPDDYLRPSILGYAPICLALALLSYFVVERPLMRVGAILSRKLIHSRRAFSAQGVNAEV